VEEEEPPANGGQSGGNDQTKTKETTPKNNIQSDKNGFASKSK
jgi:hypothetical protein